MIFIQWNSAYERSTASEQALMLVFFSVQVPHRMSCACLASLAESYIIEVVFWLFLSKTGYAYQTTAFTELVTGLPLVLRARESSFSTDHSKHWPRIERGTCARLSEHTV